MRTKALSFDFEKEDDSVSVTLCDEKGNKVLVGISGNWEIFVGNDHEERAYRVVRTKHRGYKLKERTLL